MRSVLEGYTGFVVPLLRSGMRVIDVGCRDEASTRSLGTAAHPIEVLGLTWSHGDGLAARNAARRASVSTVDFVVGEPHRLPLPAGSVDVVFCHDVVEHVVAPWPVLTEFFRVLRPGGTLALSTVDWGRVKLRPRTANVDAALRGRHVLHRRAGGDPFAGRRVPEWLRRAGFHDVRSRVRYYPGGDYLALAREVEASLAAAIDGPGGLDQQLVSAARSAWMWVRGGQGEFSQCWVETLATR